MRRLGGAAGTAAPPVRVDVLGPLRLTVGDTVVEVPGPKRRALLALLATAEGRALPADHLVDALWPAELPDSARASLHSQISRLRRHLGSAAGRLEGRSGGYRLHLDDGGTDVARVRSLLSAAARSTPEVAKEMLGEARLLWRGEPLAEFADVAPLAALAPSLARLRRMVEESYAAAALDAGAPDEAADVAGSLVADDPLSEPAVLILMRALHASGRSADALRVGYDHRRRLRTEAGLDPTPALARLERDIAAAATQRSSARRPLGPLRGRDSELAALHRLLTREHLVTVLGPAGVGKSRLAAEIAARGEPVTVLRLAPVTAPALIPDALAGALDLRVVQGGVLAACAALLAAGPQLLLIDNCEHLLPGVRDVVATLLDRCPQLTVLATSREPLGLTGEQRLRLAPLALAGARSPAVAVFVDRARRVRQDFLPSADELGLVSEIARRLDGLPLAIELAAGRLSSLGLADIHARLDRALDLLGEGGTTLRQTIAWSYDLLPDHERRLFRHLAVFPDGLDLPTAESIATRLRLSGDAAGCIAHLVDASMVEVALDVPARYRMLDAMRTFARDQLVAEGEDRAATEGFVRWALELAEWVDRTIDTAEEGRADEVLRRETANLRAAWDLIRAQHRLGDAVRLVCGLAAAAGWRDLTEIWAWALELADDPAITTHPDAALVLGIAAESAWNRGELDRTEHLARRGLGAAGNGGWRCTSALAFAALSRGDLPGAIAHGTAAAASAPRPEPSQGIAALAAAYGGDLGAATALNHRVAEIAVSPTLEAMHRYVAGEIDALAGDANRAEQHYEQAIALARASGATFASGIAAVGLLSVRAGSGRVAEALAGYRDLLDYWERTGGWFQQWTTLRNLARLLHTLGDDETALLLDTAADHAPDASAVVYGGESITWDLPAERMSHVRTTAATAGRAQVLDIARSAIARHHAAASRGAGQRSAEPGQSSTMPGSSGRPRSI